MENANIHDRLNKNPLANLNESYVIIENTIKAVIYEHMPIMPLAHYYDVDRELHELQNRGELVPTRNEIMGKIGASMLLSYSSLVSYVTREGLGFVRVLHSRVVVSSCSYIRGIAKQSTRSLLFYEKNTIVSYNRAKLVLSSASDQIILNMFKTFIWS